MSIDSANLSTWTGAGWTPVTNTQGTSAPTQDYGGTPVKMYFKDGSSSFFAPSQVAERTANGWSTSPPGSGTQQSGVSSVQQPSAPVTQQPSAPVVQKPSPPVVQQQSSNVSAPIVAPVLSGNWGTGTEPFLVKFTSDPNGSAPGDQATVWEVDPTTKGIRPFLSEAAFNAYYKGDQSYWGKIHTVGVDSLQSGSPLGGYTLLGIDAGIKDDGTKLQPNLNPAEVQNHYGKPDNADLAFQGVQFLTSIFNEIGLNGPKGGFNIPKSFLDGIMANAAKAAVLVNAIAYGGYNPQDIMREVKREYLVSQGNTALENVPVISTKQEKNVYAQSKEYLAATSNPSLTVPTSLGAFDSQTIQKTLAQIPNAAFQDLVKPANMLTDPSFKAGMDAISENYFDILNQQLSATNDRDKAIADYNYQNLKKDIQQKYGVTLSDNAVNAWNQIQTLTGQQGDLLGSGIGQEQIDGYLAQVRSKNALTRTSKLSDAEKADASQYVNYASPADIQKLITEDQAKGLPKSEWRAVKWGLVPDDSVAAEFSMQTLIDKLKKDNPSAPDWKIAQSAQDIHNAIFDENGNYRSTLYSKLITNQITNNQAKSSAQQTAYEGQLVQKEKDAYGNYTSATLGDPKYFGQPAATSGSSTFSSSGSGSTGYSSDSVTLYKGTETLTIPSNGASYAESQGWSRTKPTAPTTPSVTLPAATATTPPASTGASGGNKAASDAAAKLGTGTVTPPAATGPKPTDYVTIYYKGDKNQSQKVMQSDYDSYWKSQTGWST